MWLNKDICLVIWAFFSLFHHLFSLESWGCLYDLVDFQSLWSVLPSRKHQTLALKPFPSFSYPVPVCSATFIMTGTDVWIKYANWRSIVKYLSVSCDENSRNSLPFFRMSESLDSLSSSVLIWMKVICSSSLCRRALAAAIPALYGREAILNCIFMFQAPEQ